MADAMKLLCDGCGQAASPEHVARRLQRLEWTTRYRPVHISTLFLGAFSPEKDADFLYWPGEEFDGEAAQLLSAVGMLQRGKAADAVQSEFQRAGYFLTHVLECPLETMSDDRVGLGRRREAAATRAAEVLRERLPYVAARIRRSLKPRRVILITEAIRPVVQDIGALDLGCPVILNNGKPFEFSTAADEREILQFRKALAAAVSG
jgi:hypothetical protein